MKYFIVFIIIFEFLDAADYPPKNTFIKFETGSSFVFIQMDNKNDVLSIISEANVPIKQDGSYCYLPDEIYKKYSHDNTLDIPDKYCQDKPPYKNIVKKFHTVMDTKKWIPTNVKDTSIKPFAIPCDNIPYEMYHFLDHYGIITNEVKKFNQKINFKNNLIELNIIGEGIRSHGMCSAIASNTINLKINDHSFLDDIIMEKCFSKSIDKIEIDFKKNIVTLYLYDLLEGKSIEKLAIPFNYFFKNKGIEYVPDEDEIKF